MCGQRLLGTSRRLTNKFGEAEVFVLRCCIFKSDGDLHPTIPSLVFARVVEFDFAVFWDGLGSTRSSARMLGCWCGVRVRRQRRNLLCFVRLTWTVEDSNAWLRSIFLLVLCSWELGKVSPSLDALLIP